jgi:deoxyribonuclease-4
MLNELKTINSKELIMKRYPLLGSYVPLNEKENYLIGALKTAVNENANTFMFYTGAPQNTHRKPVSDFHIEEFRTQLETTPIDLNTLCIHAPYVINLANSIRPEI